MIMAVRLWKLESMGDWLNPRNLSGNLPFSRGNKQNQLGSVRSDTKLNTSHHSYWY